MNVLLYKMKECEVLYVLCTRLSRNVLQNLIQRDIAVEFKENGVAYRVICTKLGVVQAEVRLKRWCSVLTYHYEFTLTQLENTWNLWVKIGRYVRDPNDLKVVRTAPTIYKLRSNF